MPTAVAHIVFPASPALPSPHSPLPFPFPPAAAAASVATMGNPILGLGLASSFSSLGPSLAPLADHLVGHHPTLLPAVEKKRGWSSD